MQKDIIKQLREDYGIGIESIVENVNRYMPSFNEPKFIKAYLYAANAHAGQFRKNNIPYIAHPVEAVRILASLHADEDTLIAALLHDVPEDTDKTIEDVEKNFGKKVAFLVEGITKLSKVHYQHDMQKRQIDSLKKLFLHTAEDPRIILIKLADRLHNMRTLQYIDAPQKRIRIARETLEIFAPIANLLGIEALHSELEDLCFRFLFVDEYETLSERLQKNKIKNQKVLDETVTLLESEFKKRKLVATIYGRQKSVYGIYKKIMHQGKRLDEFDDVISLRILVQEIDDCYKALGLLHAIFKPRPGKFKDYIAVPKVNGYRSLHTTVFGLNGMVSEFQIRTNQMHLEAEHGVAAHFGHEGSQRQQAAIADKRHYWAEKIKEMQEREHMDKDFMEDLRLDIFSNRMFVFTPKGDSIDLPYEATAIDFAYAIHSEVGNRALKAEINGKMQPMATALQNGDTVRIITSDDLSKGPDRRWIAFAKTNSAKNKIKEFFKKGSRDDKINIGTDLLQRDFDRAGLGLIKDIPSKKIKEYCEKNGYKFLDDIFIAIGEGSLNSLDFINGIYKAKDDAPTLGYLKHLERKVEVKDKKEKALTPVMIKVISKDAIGQLRKLLSVMSDMDVNVLKADVYINFWTKNLECKFLVAAHDFKQVSTIFEKLEQIEGVKRVVRIFWQRKIIFFTGSVVAFVLWALHPFAVRYLTTNFPAMYDLTVYGSVIAIFGLIAFMRNLSKRNFPDLRENKIIWLFTYMLSGFALVTLSAEIYFLNLKFNWFLYLGLIGAIIAYLFSQGYREIVLKKPTLI